MNEYRKTRIAQKQSEKMSRARDRIPELAARKEGFSVSIERVIKKKMNERRRQESVLPHDRRCPICTIVKMERVRWFVTKDQKVICRACAIARRGEVDPVHLKIQECIVYKFDKDQLVDYSVRKLANGLKLNPRTVMNFLHTGMVSQRIYDRMRLILPFIKFEPAETTYRYSKGTLKQCRLSLCLGFQDFANLCDINRWRFRFIEEGKILATAQEHEKIQEVLKKLQEHKEII